MRSMIKKVGTFLDVLKISVLYCCCNYYAIVSFSEIKDLIYECFVYICLPTYAKIRGDRSLVCFEVLCLLIGHDRSIGKSCGNCLKQVDFQVGW